MRPPQQVFGSRLAGVLQRSSRPIKAARALAAISVLAGAAAAALGDDYFINTAGGDWFTASNWSNNAPPGSSDNAYLGYDFGGATFSDPSSINVTFLSGETTIQSLYSKSNLQLEPTAPDNGPALILEGTTCTFDPSVTLTVAASADQQPSAALLAIRPAANTAFTLNANITEGNYVEVALGRSSAIPASVTYGAGYVWNINTPNPGLGGNTTDPVGLDSSDSPFILNGTINLTNGSSAAFGKPTITQPSLTIGSTGALNETASTFYAADTNNQGAMALTGGSGSAANFTNSGTLTLTGGATFSNLAAAATTTNTGAISADGSGTLLQLQSASGAGSIAVTNGAELDLLNFDNSLTAHLSLDSTAIVQLGGTITTAPGDTFDFTKFGSHVSFGIVHGNSASGNGTVSFSGGTVIHSDQIDNVQTLTNVSLDHGLTVNPVTSSDQTQFNGTINAGDQPITVTSDSTLILNSGATLNGNVVLNDSAIFTLGGTLNGNITNNGNCQINLGAAVTATCTITNNGSLYGSAQNGALLAGSNLNFAPMTQFGIGNFTFDAGSSFTMPDHEIDIYSSWTNAGNITFTSGGVLSPDPQGPGQNQTATITNTGTMTVPAGATLQGWGFIDDQDDPLANSGSVIVNGRWEDYTGNQRTVSNSATVTINPGGEIDQWEYSQSAGKTLVNGLLYFAPDGEKNPLGTATLAGGTLAGAGTIERYAISATGGTLLAGDDGAPATLSLIDSTLTLGQNATLESQILSATQFGQFAFSGTDDSVALGGTLDVGLLPGAEYTRGQVFTLITADAITGTFDSLDLPDGWEVNYSPTAVSVTALPEPAALGFVLTATALLSRRRRRSVR